MSKKYVVAIVVLVAGLTFEVYTRPPLARGEELLMLKGTLIGMLILSLWALVDYLRKRNRNSNSTNH